MKPDKKLLESKKARVLGIALLNLNLIFLVTVFKKDIPIDVVTQMITAVLFLVGIYTGVQGGIDMIQSNKLESLKVDEKKTETVIHKMEYAKDDE
jgi:hypothetical protein